MHFATTADRIAYLKHGFDEIVPEKAEKTAEKAEKKGKTAEKGFKSEEIKEKRGKRG